MAQELNIEQKLHDLLVSRDFHPELTGKDGRPSNADEAKTFTFDYVSGSGKNYGTMVIVLANDNEMKVMYGDNLGKTMEGNDKQEFFDFIQALHQFAVRNFWTYSSEDLSKLKYVQAGMAAIKEGLFEGYYGNRRVSYTGEPTQARMMIRHNRALGENDARFRYVESIYIETADQERFRLPFTNMTGARAMLEHVRQGGRPYDVRGNHIAEMVSELKVLNRFNRASAGRVMEGTTQTIVEQAQAYYQSLRESLKRMTTSRGYAAYFESWHPAEIGEHESLVEDIKTMFVQQTLDTRIEAALPLLARIQQQGNAVKEADIFESWINRLAEGTWATPDTPEKMDRLRELMTEPLIVGADAVDATEQLYDIVGDDILFDQLAALAAQDPAADARQIVQQRLEQMGIVLDDGDAADQEISQGVVEDAVADFLARGGQIQQGKFHKPRKSEKTDYGSRHIGGVRDAVAGKAGKTLGRAAATNFMGGGKAVVGEGDMDESMGGTVAGAIAPMEEGMQADYKQQVFDQILDGEVDAYDVMSRPQGGAQEYVAMVLQDMYDDVARDHRLHPDDDFEQILDIVVDRIEKDYGHSADQGVAEGSDDYDDGEDRLSGRHGLSADPKKMAVYYPNDPERTKIRTQMNVPNLKKAINSNLGKHKKPNLPEQGVAEGSLNEGQYEMMLRNGQVKKFVAKDDADAKRIAAGHGAKSLIRLKGGVPAGKVSEQGVAEMDKSQPSHGRDGRVSHSTYGSRDRGGSTGKEHTAKMTTADRMMKDAHAAMMRSMSDADKVKKGWRNPNMKEEGVAEGGCNATMEGEMCPEHGLAECGMHESVSESRNDDALLARIKSLALIK